MPTQKGTPHHEALRATREMVRTALFATLTAVGGLLAFHVPFSIIPITLQLVFTLMSGLFLGSRNGALSQLIYVVMGAIGMPVFSQGSAGVGVLLGPTGGYLIGFVAGAWVTGLVAEAIRKVTVAGHPLRLAGYLAGALTGIVIVYVLGVWRLATVLQVSLRRAIVVGAVPFAVGDVLKAVTAALLVMALEKRGLGQG